MIRPSHRTIKAQAARHGVSTTLIEGELFAAEEVPVRFPHNDMLWETSRLELPICGIDAGTRFQDMKRMRLKSRVLTTYQAVEERRKNIERANKAQLQDTKEQFADELRSMGKIRVGYND